MEYNFRKIEEKWQRKWVETGVYKVPNQSGKPKYYVLDMFPYPSGAGLHVGHPLGYIASDIIARYKRLKGFNVLHPMGYDAFGLPAEQYALEHGVHPAVSTGQNINNFRAQLDKIGFCFDWSREVNTSQPHYYKWTQWIFLQLFKSWYNRKRAKTEPIDTLITIFEREGNGNHRIPDSLFQLPETNSNTFTAEDWKSFDEKAQQTILMEYRIAYCGYGEVNWCEALGTVLANDEVVNGVSERGGYPVVKKKLRQWYLRITEYADRLLEGLNTVDFSEAMKEMQSNWIGKSSGAEIWFDLTPALSTSGEGGGRGAANVPKYTVNDKKQYESARANRKQGTEAEELLWQKVRNTQLGVKFRRQHPIDGFIADFVCLQEKLIVEIDGGYHNQDQQKIADEERTFILSDIGFRVIRFTNEEVLQNISSVINQIKTELVPSHNAPLSTRGEGPGVRCYTTRPDTIFGVDFLVLAPEHELVETITTPEQKKAVAEYIAYVKSRSERERMAEKKITGVFTGAYAVHPFNGKQLPVWISEYVLAGYGTGAIMAVPSGDERDHKFAKHFNLPITNIAGASYNGEEAYSSKDLILENSDFLNGMNYRGATEVVIKKLEEIGAGHRKVNYKMRDAAFSRQRYWGEPFPIVWKDGIAYPLPEEELPLELPYVESYKPGPEGEGPLANMPEWYLTPALSTGGEGETARRETNTMPGYAGSSWYFLRYMDPHNEAAFCEKDVSSYWNQVDLYVGGTEHAVGHLLYSRMWTKALYDLGLITFDEPFKKLLNQGMVGGYVKSIFRLNHLYKLGPGGLGLVNVDNFISDYGVHPNDYKPEVPTIFVSKEIAERLISNSADDNDKNLIDDAIKRALELKNSIAGVLIFDKYIVNEVPLESFLVEENILDTQKFKVQSRLGNSNSVFVSSGELFYCKSDLGKMSKRYYNTVNPDDVVEKYGADTFRMYEMFLGPVEMSKPWDTKGIEGVHRFLKKLWRLFVGEQCLIVTEEAATDAELKILHKTIKKISDDTERYSFNTAVSAFMVCVNELMDLKCHKRQILEPLLILLAPYAPHIAEELYHQLRHSLSTCGEGRGEVPILDAPFPQLEEKYLVESTKEYPVSINGRLRTLINMDLDASPQQVEEIVLSNEVVRKWLEGREPKKFIYVKGRMVNVVV